MSSIKNVYSTSNKKVAKVSSSTAATKIKIKAVKKGTATIKIKVNGVKTFKIKVKVQRGVTFQEMKDRMTFDTVDDYSFNDLKGD